MPHFPKPFYRKSRGLWYVELNGKQTNLGHDRHEAFRRYHQLSMAPARDTVVTDDPLVDTLCDRFLDWAKKNQSAATFAWYRIRLTPQRPLEQDLAFSPNSPATYSSHRS